MKKIITCALFTACFSMQTFSETLEDPTINGVVYGGTGCPQGSVAAIMTPDFKTISVIFDEYVANSDNSLRGRETKTCDIGVSVHVPHGLSVSMVELDYRGQYDMDGGAYAKLQADYFFAGDPTGSRFTKEWNPASEDYDSYFLEDELGIGTIVWSPCGEDVILRAATSLQVDKAGGDWSILQMTSTDVNAELLYQLQWETCDQ